MFKKSLFLIFIFVFIIILFACASEQDDKIQWALNNNGEKIMGVRGVIGIDIGLPDLKQLSLNDNRIAIIALVDSKIDADNKYLTDTIIDRHNEDLSKDTFHGTAVAGIITAHSSSNDYKGILSNALLYPIQLDLNDFDVSELIDELGKAEEYGVKIVNCSFTLSKYSEDLYDFISRSDMIFICAAGNENKNEILYPAGFDLPNIISVMAINNYGYCSSYSNYSPDIDIAAPGENILCLGGEDGFEYLSGSSLATPFVTAACAYIIDRTECDASDVKMILLNNTVELKSLKGKVNEGRLLSIDKIISYLKNRA